MLTNIRAMMQKVYPMRRTRTDRPFLMWKQAIISFLKLFQRRHREDMNGKHFYTALTVQKLKAGAVEFQQQKQILLNGNLLV